MKIFWIQFNEKLPILNTRVNQFNFLFCFVLFCRLRVINVLKWAIFFIWNTHTGNINRLIEMDVKHTRTHCFCWIRAHLIIWMIHIVFIFCEDTEISKDKFGLMFFCRFFLLHYLNYLNFFSRIFNYQSIDRSNTAYTQLLFFFWIDAFTFFKVIFCFPENQCHWVLK